MYLLISIPSFCLVFLFFLISFYELFSLHGGVLCWLECATPSQFPVYFALVFNVQPHGFPCLSPGPLAPQFSFNISTCIIWLGMCCHTDTLKRLNRPRARQLTSRVFPTDGRQSLSSWSYCKTAARLHSPTLTSLHLTTSHSSAGVSPFFLALFLPPLSQCTCSLSPPPFTNSPL